MSRCRGFTLLELLVVVLIVGLGVAVVSLSVSGGRDRQLLAAAEALAGDTAAVADMAVLDVAPWGLQFYRQQVEGEERFGYRWLRLGAAGWQPLAPPRLPAGDHFASGVEAELTVEGSEQPIEPLPPPTQRPRLGALQPHVWMAPGGEMTPFELRLRQPGAGGALLRGDALGRLELERLDGA